MAEVSTTRLWLLKKELKALETAKGNGTSMISIIIPPGGQINKVSQMLTDELGTATNIKSRVNRQSVLGAIVATQQRLKLHSTVPPNGLAIYCGTALNEEGKERKISVSVVPFKPVNTSLYMCDSRFHTEALQALLKTEKKYGFIIVDGKGALYGTVSGDEKVVVSKFSVDLPKKHGMGGQSAQRFGRLRQEKRHNYVRKVCETATTVFITDNVPNVAGLIVAGSAELKNNIVDDDLFDERLKKVVIKTLDITYGGENGFNEAINASKELFASVELVEEKNLLTEFFSEIGRSTDKYCFGIKDTLTQLEAGAVEKLILFEGLEAPTPVSAQTPMPLLDYLIENSAKWGATVHIVTDKTQEGTQFCHGFGGIGGILRWANRLVDEEEGVEICATEFVDDDDFC